MYKPSLSASSVTQRGRVPPISSPQRIKALKNVVVHQVHESEPWFSAVKAREKTVHVAISHPRSLAIQPADVISIHRRTGKKEAPVPPLRAVVTSVSKYPTVEALLRDLGISRVLPGLDAIDLGVALYNDLFPDEAQRANGVLALCIDLIDDEVEEPESISPSAAVASGRKGAVEEDVLIGTPKEGGLQLGNDNSSRNKDSQDRRTRASVSDASLEEMSSDIGSVYTWNGFHKSSPRLEDGLLQERVCQVALGKHHDVFLTEAGTVLASGGDEHGQLGLGINSPSSSPSPTPATGRPRNRAVPALLPALAPHRVLSVACGALHTAAITSTGQLFTWGSNKSGQCGIGRSPENVSVPTLVEFPDNAVVVRKVSCGATHTVCLTAEHYIWSWGEGPQLGLGSDLLLAHVPKRITSLDRFATLDVACGGHHTLALCVSREVAIGSSNAINKIFSWGRGAEGQLGHGDTADLSVPQSISALNSMRVVQIAAGKYHSVARTCLAHVYTWGEGESHQLGHFDSKTCPRPTLVSALFGEGVVHVAAGDNMTLFLCSSLPSYEHRIFLCGPETQTTKNVIEVGAPSSLSANKGPVLVPRSSEIGFIRNIAAGGTRCALVCDRSSKVALALRKLTGSEISYVNRLRTALRIGLLPLRSGTGAKPPLNTAESTLERLIQLVSEIWQCSCVMVARLVDHLATWRPHLKVARIVSDFDLVTLYRKYVAALTDAIAMGVFTNSQHAKTVEESFAASDCTEFQSHEGNGILWSLFYVPLGRMSEYEKMLCEISESLDGSDPAEASLLNAIARNWDTLGKRAFEAVSQAEYTAAFWAEYPHMRKLYVAPHRRVLKHSKVTPLLSPKSVIHSTNWFILFNDIFVHSQMFSSKPYPLQTTWVQDMSESELGRCSFRLVFPLETMSLLTNSPEEKEVWMVALRLAIASCASLDQDGFVVMKEDAGDGLGYDVDKPLPVARLESRRASFSFKNHPVFKDCHYNGEWLNGSPTGHGLLACSDGRTYQGNFRNGLCHGFATMTGPPELGDMRRAEGNWEDGRLHGLAQVEFNDGSTYTGDWSHGLRHGYGVLVFANKNRYVGMWENDMKSGYGVYDDVRKGEKYLGMWSENERHGFGIVVHSSGTYFEGTFVHSRYQGHGLLLDENETCVDCEFGADGQLQGKGRIIFPTGQVMEGTFGGFWRDPTGIRISNAVLRVEDSFELERNMTSYDWEPVDSRGKIACKVIPSTSRIDPSEKWLVLLHRCKKQMTDSVGRLAPTSEMLVTGSNKLAIGQVGSAIEEIEQYLSNAFHLEGHPLQRLLDDFVSAFHTSYKGAGAHRRLLTDAVAELRSTLTRIEDLLAFLYPELRSDSEIQYACGHNAYIMTTMSFSQETLEPLLFSRVYSALYTLYVLNTQHQDSVYWKNLNALDDMSDAVLMERLGVDRRFWLMTDEEEAAERVRLSVDASANVPEEKPVSVSRTQSNQYSFVAVSEEPSQIASFAVMSPRTPKNRREVGASNTSLDQEQAAVAAAALASAGGAEQDEEYLLLESIAPPIVSTALGLDNSSSSTASAGGLTSPSRPVNILGGARQSRPDVFDAEFMTPPSSPLPHPYSPLANSLRELVDGPIGRRQDSAGEEAELDVLLTPKQFPTPPRASSSPKFDLPEASSSQSIGNDLLLTTPLQRLASEQDDASVQGPETPVGEKAQRKGVPLGMDAKQDSFQNTQQDPNHTTESKGEQSPSEAHHVDGRPQEQTVQPNRASQVLSPHLVERALTGPSPRLSSQENVLVTGPRYSDAAKTLRRMSSVFSPAEKLRVFHTAFAQITAAVKAFWGDKHKITGMDELLPVFLSVLVRARIQHLGSEIRFFEDFINMDAVSGESRVLLTTLRASYVHLQTRNDFPL